MSVNLKKSLSREVIFGIGLLLVIFSFGLSLASAAPLTYNASTTISITTPSTSFTIVSSSVADSLTTYATSVAVILSSSTGGNFTLTSASYDLSIATSSAGGTVAQSCSSGVASTTISHSTGSSTYTITPSASACVLTISGLGSNPSSYGVVITWTTNYSGSSVVSYGATTSYGSTSTNATLATSHTALILNLSPGSTYHYLVTSAAGSTSISSADSSFTTPNDSGTSGGGGSTSYTSQTQTAITPVTPVLTTTPVAVPSVTQNAASQSFSVRLKVGVTSDDVKQLQGVLVREGVYPEGIISGYFGSFTRKAVQQFQKKYGIANSGEVGYGEVGPNTRAKLNQLISDSAPTISTPVTSPTQVQSAEVKAQIQVLQSQLEKLLIELAKILQSQVQELKK